MYAFFLYYILYVSLHSFFLYLFYFYRFSLKEKKIPHQQGGIPCPVWPVSHFTPLLKYLTAKAETLALYSCRGTLKILRFAGEVPNQKKVPHQFG